MKKMKLRLLLLFLFGLFCNLSWAQQKITGVVTDDKGAPLGGVSVSLKDSKKGVSTNVDGTFTIDAGTGEVLEFSMVGFKAQSV